MPDDATVEADVPAARDAMTPGDDPRQAAASLGPGRAARWVGDTVVEVEHVAVAPSHQSRGVGRALLAALQGDALAPQAILAVHPDALPAQRLYEGCGWEVADPILRLGDGPPARLMGRRLP